MRIQHRIQGLSCALGICVLVACGGGETREPSPRSTIQVSLPAPPQLKPPVYKKAFPDGVLTVEGLLRNRDRFLQQTVRVRGIVERVALCQEVKRPVQRRKKRKRRQKEPTVSTRTPVWDCPLPPYAILVDGTGSTRFRLRVGGDMSSQVAKMTQGETAVVEGVFDLVSPGGRYVDQQGLIFLPKVEPPKGPQAP